MAPIDLIPSGEWTDPFTWDGLFIRMHIRAVKLDYDATNPQTWPLIKDLTQTDNGSNYKKSKTPPPWLAYDQPIMVELHKLQPMHRVCRAVKQFGHWWRNESFAYYPFNFDSNGDLKEYPHILGSELVAWRELLVDVEDEEEEEEQAEEDEQVTRMVESKQAPKTIPSPTPNTTEVHPPSPPQPPHTIAADISTQSAFEQIMKKLTNPKDPHARTIASEQALNNANEDITFYRKELRAALETMDDRTNELRTTYEEKIEGQKRQHDLALLNSVAEQNRLRSINVDARNAATRLREEIDDGAK